MKFYCYFILLMFSASTKAANTSCNSLRSLVQELYNTPGNLLNLNQVFYPPHQPTTSFVRVTYSFQNENDELDGCDVLYLWAKGGFLLIQPPSIFRFTSLLFNHGVNEKRNLNLILPNACRHLVERNNSTTNSSECKCDAENEDLLDILTHKVKGYDSYSPTIM